MAMHGSRPSGQGFVETPHGRAIEIHAGYREGRMPLAVFPLEWQDGLFQGKHGFLLWAYLRWAFNWTNRNGQRIR